jgi:hypothetical protein
MQHEHNTQQPEHLDNEQMETTSKLEWVQPVLQKAPIAETAGQEPNSDNDEDKLSGS